MVTCKCTLTSSFFPVSLLTQTHFLCQCLTFLPRGSHDISNRLIVLLSYTVVYMSKLNMKCPLFLTHFPNVVYGALIEFALFAVCGMEATVYYEMQN